MIKLDDISTICNTLAVSQGKNPLADGFEVNVFLPFPFFDGLQRELSQMTMEAYVEGNKIDSTQSMKFMDIRFPSGILVHIQHSDQNVVFEPVVKKAKLVSIPPSDSFLRPGGQRA